MEHIAGDGEYAIEVVSGSRHQDRLEWLAQGRGEEPKEYACTAVLTHEPDNPFDPNAVSVSILGVRVGFLSRDAAASFVGAMDTWDFEQASCDAIIEGGWYRNAEDKGDFCVMLDANPDFVPAEFPPADDSLLEAVALPATTASARSGYAIRSMGLGAIATMAMLAVVGAVLWMMPQQRANYSPAAASRVQAPEPALLASADTRRREGPAAALRPVNDEKQADTATATPAEARERPNPEPAVVTSTRSVSVAAASAAQSARPAPSVAQRATIARTLAPQEPATVAPPIVSTVAGEGPTHETAAADTAGTQLAETPAGVEAVGERSIEALPAPVASEVQTVSDRKTVIAATSVADEIDPPVTTASSPPAPPSPLPRPDPPEAAGDDSPPPTAVIRAAQPERKARSRYQRARFNRRSRSARSYTRSRSAVRSSRSERRAPREEVASASAPERPPSAGIKLPNTPAARMLQGWTNELTSASSQLKRSGQ
jgi:hypothetical protein